MPNDGSSEKPSAQLQTAVGLRQLGKLEQAQIICEQLVRTGQFEAEALHQLGIIAYQRKQFSRAVELIDKAIAINPTDEAFYSNRGLALHEIKKFDLAIADFDRAIAHKADYVLAYYNRGNSLQALKKFDVALADYDKAISLKPDYAEAYSNRGVLLLELRNSDLAIADFDKAIAIDPKNAVFHNNRGLALKALKKLDAALADYDKAISLKADYAEAYSNRGVLLRELQRFDAAIADCDKAISLRADYAEAYINRGNALKELKKLGAALADYDKAISLKSDFAPAYWNKALTLLLGGDLQNGFELHEWRWKALNIGRRDFVQPLWLGEAPLQGKTILLHSEQGLGDTLQFSRYASLVAKSGAQVLLEVQKPLVGILKGLEGISRVLAQGEPLPAFDYHCPLLSLPLALRTTLKTIPADIPHIKAGQEELEVWSNRLGRKRKPRIGLAWSGSPLHKKDRDRNIEIVSLLPYLPNGCEYFALQKDLREYDKAALNLSAIHYLGEELEDFKDTAALCELMDLVVSVDTSLAHLSGALGKLTWILLPYVPDWRWLLNGDDSPWYPTVKLYRQNSDMKWGSVLESMRQDLMMTKC